MEPSIVVTQSFNSELKISHDAGRMGRPGYRGAIFIIIFVTQPLFRCLNYAGVF
jgi:hypothetical protein